MFWARRRLYRLNESYCFSRQFMVSVAYIIFHGTRYYLTFSRSSFKPYVDILPPVTTTYISEMTNDWWKRHRMLGHGGESLKVCTATTLSSSDWHGKSRPACQQQALHSNFSLHSMISGRWTNRAELFWLWRLCHTICFVCFVERAVKSKRFALGQA